MAQNEGTPEKDNLVGKICNKIIYPCNDQSDTGNCITYAIIILYEKRMVWTLAII